VGVDELVERLARPPMRQGLRRISNRWRRQRVSRGRTPRLCGQPTPRPRESLPLPRLALRVDWTALELVSKWRR
jgi:hypothetical protein